MGRKQRRQTQAISRPPHAGHDALARDFREAVRHLRDGNLERSAAAHQRVLSRAPNHAPSLLNLGIIAFKTRARSDAIDYIRRSLDIDPTSRDGWLNLAIVLGEARHLDEAIAACRQCLALSPSDAKAHSVLGSLLKATRNTTDAVAAYDAALKLDPNQPSVLVKMGKLLLQSGQPAEAMTLCRRALELAPDLAEARQLERQILNENGDLEASVALIAGQADTPAELARLYDELARNLRGQRRFHEAVAVQRRALAYAEDCADFHFNLAAALEGAGLKRDALVAYQQALAIDPGRAEGYTRVGVLLRKMDLYEGAVTAFREAVRLDPSLVDGHYNLAVTLKQMNRLDEAREALDRAVTCAPESVVIRFERIHLMRMSCDWTGLEDEERRAIEMRRRFRAPAAPFLMLPLATTRADQLSAGQYFSDVLGVPAARRFKTYPNCSKPGERIRIGYLSADFSRHATAMLMAEVLEKADRNRFEIVGYCFSQDDGSELRERVKAAFDRFVDIRNMSDEDAAKTIHDDGIDILVDLKGYTLNARTAILAYKPAPVQVNYLGYPGSMGGDFMDYILADPIITPMEHQPDYSERIVQLPHCYQPNDRQRVISDAPMTRAQQGLPDDAFVFCSFNNNYKISPDIFRLWMRLLSQVSGSVLWVLVKSPVCRANLVREAEASGIDPQRIVFAEPLPNPEHLARHRLADLFLDTSPCNAHTTASDALWAGLPVVTLIGETFAGRVAASLLAAMDLNELIADSHDAYERLALTLARDRSQLDAVRRKIAERRETSPLFDSTRYAQNLERAYETMVDIMRSGEAPRPFAVTEQLTPGVAAATSLAAPAMHVAYDQCPVCDGTDIPYQIEAKVSDHGLYKPELPPTVKWRACEGCGHFFTEGYFTSEAREIVTSSILPEQEVGHEAGRRRKVSARIVERVARHMPSGEWLDIGAGNGSLLFTAAEWGYEPIGMDRRIDTVERLLKLGYKAFWNDIETIEQVEGADRFNVVSLHGVLPRAPLPKRALSAVHRLMRQGGVLFLSMPNMDTIEWRILDATGTNPYWGELEHHHNFTRGRVVRMLEAQGFRIADYNVGEDGPSAMEIIAIKL